MGVYIIRPKESLALQSLSLTTTQLTLESRQKQIKTVLELQHEDPAVQDLVAWGNEAAELNDVKLLNNPNEIGVTSSLVVEMSEEKVAMTLRDLPSAMVLQDRPIELIHPARNTASFKSEGNLEAEDLWHLNAVALSQSAVQSTTGKGTTVAVLDTGVDSTHPALSGKVTGAFEFDPYQWSATEQQTALDTDGHGTHVAALICGRNVGVAPDAKVISGIMLPQARGNLSNFILALEWAASQPEIQIVNISAGLQGFSPEMDEMIQDLLTVGILPVCAVGNEGRDRTRSPGNYRSVISVGASTGSNIVAGFSSSGTLTVNHHTYGVPHLVAPGEQVYSAIVAGGYEAWNGTSMAAPIVSGVATLWLERYPEITVSDLREELLRCCQDLGEPPERQGKGIIQWR